MTKLTDLQKRRLESLKRQLYGKPHSSSTKPTPTTDKNIFQKYTPSAAQNSTEDIGYLKKDLLKIVTLSSGAIAIQVLLFFLSQNHIINLKF